MPHIFLKKYKTKCAKTDKHFNTTYDILISFNNNSAFFGLIQKLFDNIKCTLQANHSDNRCFLISYDTIFFESLLSHFLATLEEITAETSDASAFRGLDWASSHHHPQTLHLTLIFLDKNIRIVNSSDAVKTGRLLLSKSFSFIWLKNSKKVGRFWKERITDITDNTNNCTPFAISAALWSSLPLCWEGLWACQTKACGDWPWGEAHSGGSLLSVHLLSLFPAKNINIFYHIFVVDTIFLFFLGPCLPSYPPGRRGKWPCPAEGPYSWSKAFFP